MAGGLPVRVLRATPGYAHWIAQSRPLPGLLSAERQLFRQITPPDMTGLSAISHVRFSSDGRAYVYSYTRVLSELYLAKGLK
jgi:hypothetical protein